MKDLLFVHEFSKLSGVETSTLRYWDDIGLFSPARRDPENNYRYYSLAQLLTLNFVTTLSELEIPLKTIAELRQQRDPENFLKLLDKQEQKMDMQMRALRRRYSIIHARRELINYGVKVGESQIAVLHREDKQIILWPVNEYQEGETFLEPLARFADHTGKYYAENNIYFSYPVGGYHESIETFVKEPGRPERFFSIDPTGNQVRKEGDYLVGFARGFYGELGDLPVRMAAYAKENAIDIHGPVYTIYLHDEICTQDMDQYLAQSCVAVSNPQSC
jgi:DNA-binding transcriptional MerR regulator